VLLKAASACLSGLKPIFPSLSVFKSNNKRYRFAKMVVELIEQLKPIQKAL
jgi:hypothetical protein